MNLARASLARAVMALAVVIAGCRLAGAPPNLLHAVTFSPPRAQAGDRLQVLGSGFPVGKTATMTFRGTLHRPGRAPVQDVEIVARADGTSAETITVELSEELQRRFCGTGDDASHTTFRGDVLVAFAPRNAGAPPVTGTVPGVVLDLPGPPVDAEVAATRRSEGARLLKLVGITSAPRSPRGGLLVEALAPLGRAEDAGLEVGDRIVSADGVMVTDVADLAPSGRARLAEVAVRRDGIDGPLTLAVDVEGFRSTPPDDLAPAAVGVGVVVAAMLFFMAPFAVVLGWTEQRVVARLRSVSATRRHGPRGYLSWTLAAARSMVRETRAPVGSGVLSRTLPPLALLAACAAFAVTSFGGHLVSPDLDLPILLLGAAALLVASGLLFGGWRSDGRWSLLGALGTALQTVAAQIPAVAAVASVVLVSGTLRFDDNVALQGGAPWSWNVFRSPTLFFSFFLLASTVVADGSRSPLDLPEVDCPSGVRPDLRHGVSRYFLFLSEWLHLLVMSGIAAALFLGGWQLPGAPPPAQVLSVGVRALGAAVFVLKTCSLVLGFLWIRWALPGIRVAQLAGICCKWLIPLSAVCVAGTFAWNRGLGNEAFRGAQGVLSAILFGLTVLLSVYYASRVLADVRSPRREAHLNPWL